MTSSADEQFKIAAEKLREQFTDQVRNEAELRRERLAQAIYEARQMTGPAMAMGNRWEDISYKEVFRKWAAEIMTEDGSTIRRLSQ